MRLFVYGTLKRGECREEVLDRFIAGLGMPRRLRDVGVKREACTMNLAPTASTTAMLAMCDALAVVAGTGSVAVAGAACAVCAARRIAENITTAVVRTATDRVRGGRSSVVH